MIRSMYAAISGLRNHQTMMDVVGNNIANVSSTGFKSSNVVFQDLLSQNLRGAGRPGVNGGTNAMQVGLGSTVTGITTNFGQGALMRTGRFTDMAISGDGFFVVSQGNQQLFTRNGAFSLDANGTLVSQEGFAVQGWTATNGEVNTNAPVGNIQIPLGTLVPPTPTSTIDVGGNLPAGAAIGTTTTTSINVYDTQGTPNLLNFTYTKTAANEWTATASYGTPATAVALTGNVMTFNAAGELTSGTTMGIAAGAIPQTGAVNVNLGSATDPERVTNFNGSGTVLAYAQNGSSAGSLESFTVSREGMLLGSYTNGDVKAIGQVATASFTNPEGLEKVGGSNYQLSANSGAAQIGVAATGGRGVITQAVLEQSNVDLAQEFTNMIVAQRGFQANSRVITTADEMLSEVVNMKR